MKTLHNMVNYPLSIKTHNNNYNNAKFINSSSNYGTFYTKYRIFSAIYKVRTNESVNFSKVIFFNYSKKVLILVNILPF